MKEKFYNMLPVFFQELMIVLYNKTQYKTRYGGDYKKYRKEYNANKNLSLSQLTALQEQKYSQFIDKTLLKSNFYKKKYATIAQANKLQNIKKLPIITKEEIRENNTIIGTISKNKGVVSKTGGTTGKSLTLVFTRSNMQERFAMLDNFRSQFGYELGKKTAWFSGKALLTKRDIKKKRFWKTDFLHKVRYYSTFHINEKNLKYYIDNLIEFSPEYLIGFPSNMYEIAKFGILKNIKFPKNTIKAIFPTAETVTETTRAAIETFFNAKMYNQYASSEGAPFIFECKNNNLHLELQSGVFEVLDNKDNDTENGRLIVTSFTTEGTPLIRYDIGDTIALTNKKCICGNNNPLVKQIFGRTDDFIYSKQTGKINLGNISNALKNTEGIIRFQVIQDKLDTIIVLLIIDKKVYSDKIQCVFIKNLRDRVGTVMEIKIKTVDQIPVEKSGKYRMIKNNIKHLL